MKPDAIIPAALLLLAACTHPDRADLRLLEGMESARGTSTYQNQEIACNVSDPDNVCARIWAHRASACLVAARTNARDDRVRPSAGNFRCDDDFEKAASLLRKPTDLDLRIYQGLGHALEFLRDLPDADVGNVTTRLETVAEKLPVAGAHAAAYARKRAREGVDVAGWERFAQDAMPRANRQATYHRTTILLGRMPGENLSSTQCEALRAATNQLQNLDPGGISQEELAQASRRIVTLKRVIQGRGCGNG